MAALTVPELALSLIGVFVGAVVQGSVGFGLGLVAVPVLSFVAPSSLPTASLLIVLPLNVAMAVRERHALDRRGVARMLAGRLAGTVPGAVLLALVSDNLLPVLIGVSLVAAAIMSALGARLSPTPGTQLGAGFVSGVMATTSSIGGPPLALVYQDRSGPELRGTLATVFVVGALLSLAGQALAGTVAGWHALFALLMVPGVAAGLWVSGRFAQWLDRAGLRTAVLVFVAVSGLVVIAQALA